jgi:hypothetical protein
MSLTVDNDKIIIESAGLNASLLHYFEQHENHLFQLQRTGDSFVILRIGERETACNESINVLYSTEDEKIQKISNLGHTPFEMDGVRYASVEGFWQGLKFSELEKRTEIASLFGKAAKKAGNRASYQEFINYRSQEIRVGSRRHWELMKRACERKFEQNEAARMALLSTGIRPLFHKPRKDSEVIPGPIMAGIWMNIRSKLRRERAMTSKHLALLK